MIMSYYSANAQMNLIYKIYLWVILAVFTQVRIQVT